MTSTILLCTDGSELAGRALAAGLAVLAPAERVVVATVVEPYDPTVLAGVSGFAGGTVDPDEYDRQRAAQRATAEDVLREAVAALGLAEAETTVLEGDPATVLCELAESLPATAMVAGSRGHGGLKRALLGSVSDRLVRHAPCPIVITSPE